MNQDKGSRPSVVITLPPALTMLSSCTWSHLHSPSVLASCGHDMVPPTGGKDRTQKDGNDSGSYGRVMPLWAPRGPTQQLASVSDRRPLTPPYLPHYQALGTPGKQQDSQVVTSSPWVSSPHMERQRGSVCMRKRMGQGLLQAAVSTGPQPQDAEGPHPGGRASGAVFTGGCSS